MIAPRVVIGLDLSLTGLGMVAVPVDWGCDFQRVHARTLTTRPSAEPTAQRIARLASDVVRWVAWAGALRGVGPYSVWKEGYATRGHSLSLLGELGGVVKHELLRQLGVVVEDAPQHEVRSLLVAGGKMPVRDRKAFIQATVQGFTGVFDDADQRDAFVVANWGLAQLSAPFVAVRQVA